MSEIENQEITKKFIGLMKKHFGIQGVHEFLMFLPNGYLDFRKPILRVAEALKVQGLCYMKAIVTHKPTERKFNDKSGKERSLVSISLSDGTTSFKGTLFGGFERIKHLRQNDIIFIQGQVRKNGSFIEVANMNIIPPHQQGVIVPTYKGKDSFVSPNTVAINMTRALSLHMSENVQNLCNVFALTEQEIIDKAMIPFPSLARMFHAIHKPRDEVDRERAIAAVGKLNGFYAVNMSLKAEEFPDNEASRIVIPLEMLKTMTADMTLKQGDEVRHITLTTDQKQSVWNVVKDLSRAKPTRHLIQGDVGCGKTFAYMIPGVAAHFIGKRVCILMPNSLLAKQVANEIEGTYPEAETLLIIGNKRPKQSQDLKNPIIIGTSAIIGWAKRQPDGYPFDLVIIDEQQKVGMSHKSAVLAEHTNMIEASATPIPRTLAHAVYGGKRVSYIENCPVEKDISTIIITDDDKRLGMEKLRSWIEKGRQVAILYPLKQPEIPVYELIIPNRFEFEALKPHLVEAGAKRIRRYDDIAKSKFSEATDESYYLIRFVCPDEKISDVRSFLLALDHNDEILLMTDDADDDEKERNIRSVEEAFTSWEKIFPGMVLKIHGGMSPDSKLDAAAKAKTGKWPVIITSTVVEIGLTMPNLFCMLVVEADNLGASTLHQLRGRLVRLGGFGEFIMHTASAKDRIPESTLARLQILCDFKKGSEIAEADMKLRGFGDLSKDAIRQSGNSKGLFPGMKVTPENVDAFLKACLKEASGKGKIIKADTDRAA